MTKATGVLDIPLSTSYVISTDWSSPELNLREFLFQLFNGSAFANP